MKKNVADKWIKALRSKKYKQCRGQLKFDGRHCCFGVLCDLYYRGKHKNPNRFGDSILYVPDEVKEWAGLKTYNGVFECAPGQKTSLIDRNEEGETFKQIANYIKRHREEL